jgi:hypothetical protein
MRFHLLEPVRIPWDELERFPDRTVFQTRPWLDFLAETQQARPVVAELRVGRDVAGYFTGALVERFGIRILGSSFRGWTTPYMGFNLLPGASRRTALQALERFAFDDLKCLHMELSDRYMHPEDGEDLGFEIEFYETYETDLTQTEQQIFNNMESACRRCVRKAERSGVRIEEVTDASGFAFEYYEQLLDVFAKQRLSPSYGAERVEALVRHLLPSGNLLLLRAFGPDGNSIATGIYPGFNQVVQFWGNASWRAHQILRPNEALHWYAMRYWKARGASVFDWGGGGSYKEKYGPRPASAPWFVKSRYKILARMRTQARALAAAKLKLQGRLRSAAAAGRHTDEAALVESGPESGASRVFGRNRGSFLGSGCAARVFGETDAGMAGK